MAFSETELIVLFNVSSALSMLAFLSRNDTTLRILSILSNVGFILWSVDALDGGNMLSSIAWSASTAVINIFQVGINFYKSMKKREKRSVGASTVKRSNHV